ncbi:MAG: hypothetical protein IT472_00315 [Thermomonas sp.]|uniref:hypothetical protein n=1 Tax=Thermomonas sp. TaxID=1971895 RepID=UPI002619D94B|nr:hypothetical protein [Thermomonas sp.]MCC7095611.1 hypothetical protein [Thermomonas sp.]
MLMRLQPLRWPTALALILALGGCTDAATRLAGDVEESASQLRRFGGSTIVLEHIPNGFPEGCTKAYDIQFSAASSLLVWCKDAKGGEATSSHTTTHHLRFVKVPETLRVEKSAGETTYITLTREGSDVVVSAMR